MTAPDSAARAAEVARASYGKLLAILASRSGGDIAAAEDALGEAFEQALRRWPLDGIPARPEGWILTVARNRRTDAARRAARIDLTGTLPEIADPAAPADPEGLPDERLKLLFVCAHPAIDAALRTPLMLQTVLGIDAAEIGRAFLVPPAAMAQRLVRAKRKIKAARIPFAAPRIDRAARTEAVLEAVYGAFALDWQTDAAPLADEALYLAHLLAGLLPRDPEALGLAALVSFVHARSAARRTGPYVPLSEQDTALWDHPLIDRASLLLSRASALGRFGRFQLEAAIQSVHSARRDTGATDWRALAHLYTGLLRIAPTLGAAVGHAAAVAEDAGPAQGLALLNRIDAEDIADYQPAWATRAHLLGRLGQRGAATRAYHRAIALTRDPAQRVWLEAARAALD